MDTLGMWSHCDAHANMYINTKSEGKFKHAIDVSKLLTAGFKIFIDLLILSDAVLL